MPDKTTPPVTKPETYDPTDGMGMGEKLLAGVGWGFVQSGRMMGNLFGLVSDEEMAEAAELDAPLLKTTEGKIGGVVGLTGAGIGLAAGGAAVVTAAGPATVATAVTASGTVARATPTVVNAYFGVQGVAATQDMIADAAYIGATTIPRLTDPQSPGYDPVVRADLECGDFKIYKKDVDPKPLAASAAFTALAAAGSRIPGSVGASLKAAQWLGKQATNALAWTAGTEVVARDAGREVCTAYLNEARSSQQDSSPPASDSVVAARVRPPAPN